MKLDTLLESPKNMIGQSIGGVELTVAGIKIPWDGSFNCSSRRVATLYGVPNKINGDFFCWKNHLSSLEGGPAEITGQYDCQDNNLKSLKGAPMSCGEFSCSGNELTSLKYAPRRVNGHFACSTNRITSLEGIHEFIDEINGDFYATKNDIISHVLGLLLIKGLSKAWIGSPLDKHDRIKLNRSVSQILNKHLPNTKGNRGVLECQNELIDAGFDEYAQL